MQITHEKFATFFHVYIDLIIKILNNKKPLNLLPILFSAHTYIEACIIETFINHIGTLAQLHFSPPQHCQIISSHLFNFCISKIITILKDFSFLVFIKFFFIFNCFFNSISWFSKLLFSYRRVSNFLVLISIA